MVLTGILWLLAFIQLSAGQDQLPSSFSEITINNETVRQSIVDIHNDFRRNVEPSAKNMLQMRWNEAAAKNAQRWAKKCKIKSSNPEDRRITNFDCGENIFMSPLMTYWKDVIEYFFRRYSQSVWYNSHELGCAVTKCPDGDIYFYVCHYCPSGKEVTCMSNPYEVGHPCEACPSACDNGLCTNHCMYEDKKTDCKKHKDKCLSDKTFQKVCGATCFCTNNEII
ncbi:cysteine-rich venom protein pseudechetoxin-like [Discoglossus pictus]